MNQCHHHHIDHIQILMYKNNKRHLDIYMFSKNIFLFLEHTSSDEKSGKKYQCYLTTLCTTVK